MANEAYLILPALTCEAEGTVACREENLTLVMELTRFAVTQYTNYNFNSFCKIGDTYVGATDKGIHELTGDTYNNIHIDSLITFLTSDFGSINQKRIRELYVGHEVPGSLEITLKADDGEEKTYILTPEFESQKQHGDRLKISRKKKGRYWTMSIANVDGCDFSIDQIDAIVIIEEKKP